ncbi:MAG TPA: GMP synthase [Candidatus Methanoculleus thermohydrogenotrophicum]|jgi:GMP synthase (glutamine-hydrolysing)|nr:GMP synthase [Candidatus Methanoculleus thermohydrogenotrophicum]HPZ38169.1 GMP synthase [Candidatus Methanoculleus thermohydrogenotrophicum]HQC91383.1 GMP synthase [Candidatus Methanoculleus thermohydrogenotrophicum]
MLPLHVVDDHGQFNHPILRTLRDVDILTTMIATDTSRHPPSAGGPSLDRTRVAAGHLDHNGGIPQGYPVRVSHADDALMMPERFIRPAESAICGVEGTVSPGERFCSVQWHPGVSHTTNERFLFENFDRICSE